MSDAAEPDYPSYPPPPGAPPPDGPTPLPLLPPITGELFLQAWRDVGGCWRVRSIAQASGTVLDEHDLSRSVGLGEAIERLAYRLDGTDPPVGHWIDQA